MRKILISVFAVLIGTVWVVAPAAAQTTKDKVEDKAESAKDKAESKTESTMDKAKEKATEAKDAVKEKAHEAKEKIVETKDKAVDKMKGNGSKATAKGEMKGDANVRSAQQALRDQGFNPGPIDGRMGPRTSAAIRDYQTKQGLTANGQLDDPTMDKLGVKTANASPATEPQSTDSKAQQKKQSP